MRSNEPRAARWQDRLERPWTWFGRGCHPNRDTLATIEASALEVAEVERDRMPKAPPIVQPLVVSEAREPGLGKSVMLPPFEDVPVDLGPLPPGEHEFSCKLGVLRGRILVRGQVVHPPSVEGTEPTAVSAPRSGAIGGLVLLGSAGGTLVAVLEVLLILAGSTSSSGALGHSPLYRKLGYTPP